MDAVPRNDPLQPQLCAELLSALAAPERLKIIRFLADGPHNVTELAEMLGIAAVNVSHRLNVLRHSQLIRGKKDGRFACYLLCPGFSKKRWTQVYRRKRSTLAAAGWSYRVIQLDVVG